MNDAEIHTIMNRHDCAKDASSANPAIDKEHMQFFNTCADALFGKKVKNWAFVDSYIANRHSFVTSENIQYLTELKVELLRHIDDKYHNVLPHFVEYAVHDSGYTPKYFNTRIKYLVTPASYIDSYNGREQSPYKYGFDKTLTQSQMAALGFKDVQNISVHLGSDQGMHCRIVCTFGTIDAKFDAKFNVLNNLYFKGNNVKNTWFNSVNGPGNENDGKSYILCKELGDVLQAHYGKLYSETVPSNTVCLFTGDNVLAKRCRLLQLPVAVTNCEEQAKGIYACIYCPAPGITNSVVQSYYISKIQRLINSVCMNIDSVLQSGFFYRQTIKYTLTDAMRRIFSSILDAANARIKKLLGTSESTLAYMNITEYKMYCKKFAMRVIFKPCNFGMIVQENVHRIFLSGDDIQLNGMTFAEFLTHGIIVGGSSDSANYDAVFPMHTYPKWILFDDEYDLMESEELCIQLCRRIYLLLKVKNPTWHPMRLQFHTESIFDCLYYLFDYVEETVLDNDFLSPIMQMTNARFIDLDQFKYFYNSWKKGSHDSSVIKPRRRMTVRHNQLLHEILVNGGHRKTFRKRRN